VKLVHPVRFIIKKLQSDSTVQCMNLRPGSPIASVLQYSLLLFSCNCIRVIKLSKDISLCRKQ